jgi:hypothetical protein
MTQAVRFDRKNAKLWENFIVIALQAEAVNESIFGIEEITRECPKWCNCPLLFEVVEAVRRSGGDIIRLERAIGSIAEQADGGFDLYTIYGDILQSNGETERALEMRKSAIDSLESGAPLNSKSFGQLVEAAKKLVDSARLLPGRVRGATQRVRALSRKYADEFGQTADYAVLTALLESLQSG